MNRLCKTRVAATSQTQWVAFTYPALMPQQDLWQIPLMVAAQGAVLRFHSLGAACSDISSLHFPLICNSRAERVHKSRGRLSEQMSWKHTQHQHCLCYPNPQGDARPLLRAPGLVRARFLPSRGKESVRDIDWEGDLASIEQRGANRC